MRKTIPKSVSTILKKSSRELKDVLTHSNDLIAYQNHINSFLDNRLQSNCQIANVRNQQLILQCSSPAWAARARLNADRILKSLNQQFDCKLNGFKIIIRPQAGSAPGTRSRPMKISSQQRRLLQQTANSIADPELAAALLRLSRSGGKTS